MHPPEAPFDEPWQAQIFALTVALNEAGHFSWQEWSQIFGPRVEHRESDEYWQAWSEALVAILERHGLAEASEVRQLSQRWQAAARAMPHGQPIALSAAPD